MKQILVSFGRAAAASVVMIALAVPAHATITATFSDRVTWSTSLTSISTTDFEGSLSSGSAPFRYQGYSTGAGLTSGIFTFLGLDVVDGSNNQSYSLTRLEDGDSNVWLKGPSKWNGTNFGIQQLTIQLANNANAFGLDIASSVAGISYQIILTSGTGGSDSVVTTLKPTTTFWGVRTDAPILQVSVRMLTAPGDTESRFDNVSAGFFAQAPEEPPPSDTPEPSTFLSMGAGLAALALTRYRRAGSQKS